MISEMIGRREFMSQLVSKVINGKYMFGKYYQFFKIIITLDRNYGYTEL